jgi:hypothetical protein
MAQKINDLRKLINDYQGMIDRNDMKELWQEIFELSRSIIHYHNETIVS